jgi:hypothetical protein
VKENVERVRRAVRGSPAAAPRRWAAEPLTSSGMVAEVPVAGLSLTLRSQRKCSGGVERFAPPRRLRLERFTPPRRLRLERFAPVGPSVAGVVSAGNGTKHSFSRRFPERKYS